MKIYYISCSVVLSFVLPFFIAGQDLCAKALDETKSTISAQHLALKQNYRYKSAGRPDPFKPFIEVIEKSKKTGAKKSVSVRPISPLQQLDISEIKLVGIAGNDRIRKAIVEDKEKRFYPIQVGTVIGTNNGVIKEILVDRVVIEEKSKVQGKIKVNHITMKLYTSEDEGRP